MFSVLFLVLLSGLISALGTPLIRRLASSRGLFDMPDGKRKAHLRPVPRVGGVAIAMSFSLSYAIWMFTPMKSVSQIFSGGLPLALALSPAAVLIFCTGLADDLWGVAAWKKLGLQAMAAVYLYQSGVQIRTLAGTQVDGFISFGLTLFWLLLCTNAFNLVDGMDGLAPGLGLLATFTTLLVAVLQGNLALAIAVAPLAGSLLGFLRYNLPPASIFLGDSGSLLIGFLLGSYAIVWTQKTATLLGLLAPIMAFAVPLLEVALSVGRRLLRGKPLFGADRGHIHHRLLDRGWSAKRTVVALHVVGLLAATFAVAQTVVYNYASGVVAALFAGLVWVAVQSLGYTEFKAAGQVIGSGLLRQTVRNEVAFETARERILKSGTAEDCWAALCELQTECAIGSLQAKLLGTEFTSPNPPVEGGWEVVLPLGDGDRVNFSDDGNPNTTVLSADHFAGIVGEALRVTLRTIRSLAAIETATESTLTTPWRRALPSLDAGLRRDARAKDRIRVLFGVNSAFAVKHLIDDVVVHYVERGYSVTVVAPTEGELELPQFIAGSVNIRRIPMEREISPIRDLQTLARLYKMMRELRPHIVDMSTPKAALLGGLAAWAVQVPARIYTIRGLRFETLQGSKRTVLRYCEVLSCRCAHKVNVISESLLQAIRRERIAPERKLVLLGKRAGDGIQPEEFEPTRERIERARALRQSLGFSRAHKVLGYVGRLTRDKGICELLTAFGQLAADDDRIKLLLIGPLEAGDLLPEWAVEMIKTHPGVIWLGYQPADATHYLAMDLFIFPTHREGLGKVVLEAQYLGLPIVSTQTTGVTDAVDAGVTGILVPPKDPQSLKEAIHELLQKPELAQSLAAAGPPHVEKYFNIHEHVCRHEGLALSLLRWNGSGGSIPRQLYALDAATSSDGKLAATGSY